MITVAAVSKSYATTDNTLLHALDGVDLTIKNGEFISLLGPSGCGKSTLLMIMAGLLPPTEGHVTIDRQPVTGPYTNLGLVFQTDVLLDWRTVLDNILLQAEIRGLDRATYKSRALQLLESVGLFKFAENYPTELSGGMRQRVSLCRALVHGAPVLLMDEPFGALDALTRDQMNLDLMQLWDRERRTVLFVTHSISEAVFLSDRVAVMTPRPGQIAEIIDIDIARPRSLSAQHMKEFTEYVVHIRDLFTSFGVLRQPGTEM